MKHCSICVIQQKKRCRNRHSDYKLSSFLEGILTKGVAICLCMTMGPLFRMDASLQIVFGIYSRYIFLNDSLQWKTQGIFNILNCFRDNFQILLHKRHIREKYNSVAAHVPVSLKTCLTHTLMLRFQGAV